MQRRSLYLNRLEEYIMKKHTVKINVADCKGEKRQVLTSTRLNLPRRFLRFLFGDFCQVLVLTPGETVTGVEIHETRKGDAEDE